MNFLHSVRSALTPLRTESAFRQKGTLTPDEFVAAGDLLVSKCPSWSWEAGEPGRAASYLPANKQFLAVRNVPCRRRCVRRGAAGDVDDEAEDDGWVASGATDAGLAAERARAGDSSSAGAGAGNAADPSAAAAAPAASAAAAEAAAAAAATPAAASGDDDDNDSIPDMDSMIPDMDALADDAAAMSVAEVAAAASATGDGGSGGGAAGGEADADAMRWYDITMTWDRFYQTPRLWLHGHDGQRRALGEAELYEDVSGDHAGKTVTRDPHPHTGVPCFSIHPCKHASVMKTFLDRAAANGKDIRPDQAAVVFLKMISCIIPFVEYDNTTSVEM